MNLKATFTLVLAAVAMVAGIFLINMITRPVIQARLNNKYIEVIAEAEGFRVYEPTIDLRDPIRSIDLIDAGSRGDILAYRSVFAGWAPGIEAVIFVYADRLEVAAVEVVSHNETVGIGDRLLESSEFLSQFNDVSGDQLLSLGVDSIAGASAPVTLAGLERAIEDVLQYHQEERLGVIVEPESEYAPYDSFVPLVSALNDRSSVYSTILENVEVIKTTEILQGTSVEAIAYRTSFTGYNRDQKIELEFIFDATSSKLLGLELIDHAETPGYGLDVLESEAVAAQLQAESTKSLDDIRVDANAGATLTTNGLEEAFVEIVTYHREIYLGIVEADTTPPVIQILARPTQFNEGDEEPDWTTYFVVTNEEESTTIQIDKGGLDMNTPRETPYIVTATITDASGNVSRASIQVTILAKEVIIEEIITPPSEQRANLFNTLYANATLFNEITAQVVLAETVTNVYRIEQDDTLLVSVYETAYDGFYPDSIRMLTFVTPEGVVDQLIVLSNNETRSYGGNLIADETFIAAFDQTSLETPPQVDSFTGATITRDSIVDNVTAVLNYHQTLGNE